MKRIVRINATMLTPGNRPVMGCGSSYSYDIPEKEKAIFHEHATKALPALLELVFQSISDPTLMDLLLNTSDAYFRCGPDERVISC